ncbi:MAG: 3'-5' exoribonuclease YhaM family protein [Desulfonatronovibrionaceae bacterium]
MRSKKIYIQDITQGQLVEDQFIVIHSSQEQAKNGPYWQLTLQDRTGTIPARIWSPQSQNYPSIETEQILHIKASANIFRDQLQLNIDHLEFVPLEESDLAFFLPVSSVPPEDLYRELFRLLKATVVFPPWITFYKQVLKDARIKELLLKAPGGKSIHHAYIGGLLEHTVGVCRICRTISELYPDMDRDILMVAAALHDIGKAMEISSGITRDYTREGRLLGHIFLGMEMITPFLNKARNLPSGLKAHFKHLMLSHHGELEFGSPKRPKTREAFVLHFADNLDAKLNTIDLALEGSDQENPEGTWSGFQRSLGRYLFNPPRTPRPEPCADSEKMPVKKEVPCLSPLKE